MNSYNDKPITGAESYDLSETEIFELNRISENGNADAAFRLAMYYEFAKYDQKLSLYFFERASKLGNNRAKLFLGVKQIQSSDPVQHAEGIRLLTEAADSGEKRAREILQEVDMRQNGDGSGIPE